METVNESDGIWQCTFVGECSRVCPKSVDPAGAIQQYKLESAVERLKSFFLPRGGR
jgi:fumarate reductase iron-sulfur subunit